MTTPQTVFPDDSVYDFYIFTGTVVENSRWNELHIGGGGGGGAVYNGYGSSYTNPVHSTNVAQGEIWLRTDDGIEENFRFSNAEIPSRPGHRMSVIGVRPVHNRKGDYTLYNYVNLTMDRHTKFPETMKKLADQSVARWRRGGTYSVWLWLGCSALALAAGSGFWEATLASGFIAWLIAWRITGPQVKAHKARLERLDQQIIDALYAQNAHRPPAPNVISQVAPAYSADPIPMLATPAASSAAPA